MSIKATISSSGRVIASAVNIASNVAADATLNSPTINNPILNGSIAFSKSPSIPGFKLTGGNNTPAIREELGLGLSNCPTSLGVKIALIQPSPNLNLTIKATNGPSGGGDINMSCSIFKLASDTLTLASDQLIIGSNNTNAVRIDGTGGSGQSGIFKVNAATNTVSTGGSLNALRSFGVGPVGGGVASPGMGLHYTPTTKKFTFGTDVTFNNTPNFPGFKLTGGNNTPAIRSELGLGTDDSSTPTFKHLKVGVGSNGTAAFAVSAFSIAADNLVFNDQGLNINAASGGGLAINNGSGGTNFVNADIDTGIFDIKGGLKVHSANTPRLTISNTNSPSIINGTFDGSPTFNGPIRFGSSPGFSYSPKAIAIATKVNFDCPITSTSTISRPVINAEANDTPVRNIQKITALAYAGLSPPDPNTLFIITA